MFQIQRLPWFSTSKHNLGYTVMRLKMAVAVWAFLWSCMLMSSFGEIREKPASDGAPLALGDYKTVSFDLNDAEGSTYRDFIKKVREQVKSTALSHGIPLLNADLKPADRYLLVALTSYSRVTVTVPINRVNVYVVGYQGSGGKASFFSDDFAEAKKYLFTTDPKPTDLGFTGSYVDLERKAGDRSGISLGPNQLNQAIKDLYQPGDDKNFKKRATALIIVIQMVSEAARFAEIEDRVADSVSTTVAFKPDTFMTKLENSWDPLSTAVQDADAKGKFKKDVKVDTVTYSTVEQVKPVLSLLLAKKKKINDDNQIGGQASHPMKIISSVISSPSVAAIVGHHDLCLQAIGASVRLRECDRDMEEQKWSLYGDGTIRPHGDPRNCLAPTYDYAIERNVIAVNACTGLLGQRWFITEAGMILSQITQNAMEAWGTNVDDHRIPLHKPNGSPGQFWRLAF